MSDITSDEQLKRWVAGESVHIGGPEHGQCCPDFSCCNPNSQTPPEERQRFADAGETERHGMRMTFLGRALAQEDPEGKVYLAGREPNDA